MDGFLTHEALNVAFPMEYLSAFDRSGVMCRATTATAESIIIPDAWFGCYWTCIATTSDVQILFGDASVEPTLNQTSGLASGVLTLNHATGLVLPAGIPISFRVPKIFTAANPAVLANPRFSHISADANGFLFIYVSQNR